MPTRIEIELTSVSPDGSWTWRAAGAREPRGVLDGSILPGGASIGDQLRVETEHDMEGIRVLSVVPGKEKDARQDVLDLLPSNDSFEPVTQQLVRGSRSDDRTGRGQRSRGDRGDRGPRGDRPPLGDRPPRGDRTAGGPRGDRGAERRDGAERRERPDRRGADRDRGPGEGTRAEGGEPRRGPRPSRPHFTPPPEVPQRPKPKRLRPGTQHRADVLASLPEEQRPIAELAAQGLAAVRQRLREDNKRLKADGKPEMPEAAVLKMAEDLLPRLRVAEWLDRADAAVRQMQHLDLRDLRSVVAAADDPSVARDEATRQLAVDLKAALVTKQEEELALWLADVEAALDVGRVVRALRLSSQPPKAGVPFPATLAARLGEATTASLQPLDAPDRWIAVLEAAAFSPIRTHVTPAAVPEGRSDQLLATVKRLGPLLPQIAKLFGVDIPPNAHVPKPLRPTTRKEAAGGSGKAAGAPARTPRRAPDRPKKPAATAETPAGAASEQVAASDGDTSDDAAPTAVDPRVEAAAASVDASDDAASTAASAPDGTATGGGDTCDDAAGTSVSAPDEAATSAGDASDDAAPTSAASPPDAPSTGGGDTSADAAPTVPTATAAPAEAGAAGGDTSDDVAPNAAAPDEAGAAGGNTSDNAAPTAAAPDEAGTGGVDISDDAAPTAAAPAEAGAAGSSTSDDAKPAAAAPAEAGTGGVEISDDAAPTAAAPAEAGAAGSGTSDDVAPTAAAPAEAGTGGVDIFDDAAPTAAAPDEAGTGGVDISDDAAPTAAAPDEAGTGGVDISDDADPAVAALDEAPAAGGTTSGDGEPTAGASDKAGAARVDISDDAAPDGASPSA